ncbi:MAG TPA: hypothetical protein DCE42_23750 [Myxococcales bacterium]|nr:hypothetical protein [Deltaproteobacteria bacterium]MBU54279.1 hypothetical protein [Deltaproteobacteria bacterium]HAA57802.1 hypothetical protein [Myxococcales bacterium]
MPSSSFQNKLAFSLSQKLHAIIQPPKIIFSDSCHKMILSIRDDESSTDWNPPHQIPSVR